MVEIKNLDDLSDYASLLPREAVQDIYKRITDWLATGGTVNDSYVCNQFKYAERVINNRK